VDSGQKVATAKLRFNNRGEVLVELFQKFAGFGAEPHFNVRAEALATALQNGEACFDILE
jgi:hypothetical protein